MQPACWWSMWGSTAWMVWNAPSTLTEKYLSLIHIFLLGDQTVITDYACDCYEYNDNSDFCSHCAALAMRAFGEGELVYQQKTGLPGGSDSALEQKPEADRVIVLSDGQNDEGQRCVQGKVLCSFGFVHHPRLRLRASEVTDYTCDCYRFFESKMCIRDRVCPLRNWRTAAVCCGSRIGCSGLWPIPTRWIFRVQWSGPRNRAITKPTLC